MYLSFISGHDYLNRSQIRAIKSVLDSGEDEEILREYERRFTDLIGSGFGLSFASGRMAFYSLLKALNIGKGDEVILLGFTCAVMPNAVLRTGAMPVFSDLDPETFGSSSAAIEKKITSRTKAIVAQHSFGIPCKIEEIAEIARKHNIYLIEDCAIALDSFVNGVKVGNFSDTAVFSTDHSKPLNTILGGFLYTRDQKIFEKIKNNALNFGHLDNKHKARLFNQFLLEKKFNRRFPYFKKITSRFRRSAFLENDYGIPDFSKTAYPYPAKMPSFLAHLGLFELGRWENEKKHRRELLGAYLNIVRHSLLAKSLPKAYDDSRLEIIPSRFAFAYSDSAKLLKIMAQFLDVSQIWFRKPIICNPTGPGVFGYKSGDCPVSEKIGQQIINWPCIFPEALDEKVLTIFKRIIHKAQK